MNDWRAMSSMLRLTFRSSFHYSTLGVGLIMQVSHSGTIGNSNWIHISGYFGVGGCFSVCRYWGNSMDLELRFRILINNSMVTQYRNDKYYNK